MKQANWQESYNKRKHTEDCLDANDDTSVLKGECICPKSEHTPTPWKISQRYGRASDGEIGIEADNELLLRTFETSTKNTSAKANAEFIIRAVSSYDAMVATLKILRDSCREALTGEWDRSDDGFSAMIENIDRVLKNTKGEKP